MTAPSPSASTRALLATLGLYATWVVLTYLLEGRPRTLLRPDAATGRLAYALVANMGVGITGGIWLLGRFIRAGLITPSQVGFEGRSRTLVSVPVGLLLGLGLYSVQGAPSWHPVVLGNAFAQVLVVSAAEVIVCWAALAGLLASLLTKRSKIEAYAAAILASGLLFGLYHFAHSPPFNTISMVLLLSAVGLATGLFYFVSRDVYGTIAFHNMLAMYGVVTALADSGSLTSFERPLWPLIGTAIAVLLLLATGHARLRRIARWSSKHS